MDKIKNEFFQLLEEIIQQKVDFDINRMRNIIKMKISEINDKVNILFFIKICSIVYFIYGLKLEDSPHETISQLCIGDFLYANLDNPNDVCINLYV